MIPVMIVEDEFLVRAGLKTSIQWEQEGFEIVAEAQNGEEALKLFEACRPAVIVTDIRLPGIDGIGMMKELRKRKAKVSFIVVSAYDDALPWRERSHWRQGSPFRISRKEPSSPCRLEAKG